MEGETEVEDGKRGMEGTGLVREKDKEFCTVRARVESRKRPRGMPLLFL